MKLSIVQTNPTFDEVQKNIDEAIALMESSPADFYVLPELFNTGYNFSTVEEVEQLAEPIEGITSTILKAFAHQRQCYIVYGFAESDDDVFYNSSALVGPTGLIGIYRKVHLYYRENIFFKRGNLGFPVFNTEFGKIGMMICFDWLFPEAARTLALKGAQLIAHPSNLVLPYCPDAMVTRCLENRVFTATANRIGSEDRGGFKFSYIGKSEIVSPNGEILTRLPDNEVNTAVIDIDLNEASNKRLNEFNDIFKERLKSVNHYL
ncbi:MAG: acyltransferase [Bacteroidetes bacterium]|nr:acyltransferase [Bacteroidota bacterium]